MCGSQVSRSRRGLLGGLASVLAVIFALLFTAPTCAGESSAAIISNLPSLSEALHNGPPGATGSTVSSPRAHPLLPQLAVHIQLLGGGEFALRSSDAAALLRAAVSSLSGVPGATAAVHAVTTSHITVDVSFLNSGATIASLKQVATAATHMITTSVDSDDRVLNKRDNSEPSRMWCAPSTLPVSGPVTVPIASVGLAITLPVSSCDSVGGATPNEMQNAALAVQASLIATIDDDDVVSATFAKFKRAWAACTGLPPAAAELAVSVNLQSVAVIPPADAVAASPAARPNPMVVIISQPLPGFRVSSGSSFSVSWEFPHGDCSSADKITILLMTPSRDATRGPPLIALAESTWPCAGSEGWIVTTPQGTPAGPHVIAVAASGPGRRDTEWRAPQMATMVILVEAPSAGALPVASRDSPESL